MKRTRLLLPILMSISIMLLLFHLVMRPSTSPLSLAPIPANMLDTQHACALILHSGPVGSLFASPAPLLALQQLHQRLEQLFPSHVSSLVNLQLPTLLFDKIRLFQSLKQLSNIPEADLELLLPLIIAHELNEKQDLTPEILIRMRQYGISESSIRRLQTSPPLLKRLTRIIERFEKRTLVQSNFLPSSPSIPQLAILSDQLRSWPQLAKLYINADLNATVITLNLPAELINQTTFEQIQSLIPPFQQTYPQYRLTHIGATASAWHLQRLLQFDFHRLLVVLPLLFFFLWTFLLRSPSNAIRLLLPTLLVMVPLILLWSMVRPLPTLTPWALLLALPWSLWSAHRQVRGPTRPRQNSLRWFVLGTAVIIGPLLLSGQPLYVELALFMLLLLSSLAALNQHLIPHLFATRTCAPGTLLVRLLHGPAAKWDHLISRHRRTLGILFIAALPLSLIGVTTLKSSLLKSESLPHHHPYRLQTEQFTQQFVGTYTLKIIAQLPGPQDFIRSLHMLRFLDELAARFEERWSEINATTSEVAKIKRFHQLENWGKKEFYRLPNPSDLPRKNLPSGWEEKLRSYIPFTTLSGQNRTEITLRLTKDSQRIFAKMETFLSKQLQQAATLIQLYNPKITLRGDLFENQNKRIQLLMLFTLALMACWPIALFALRALAVPIKTLLPATANVLILLAYSASVLVPISLISLPLYLLIFGLSVYISTLHEKRQFQDLFLISAGTCPLIGTLLFCKMDILIQAGVTIFMSLLLVFIMNGIIFRSKA